MTETNRMKHLSYAALAALTLACLATQSQAGGHCASAARGRQFSQRTYSAHAARNVGHSYGYAAKTTIYSYAAQQGYGGYDQQAQQQQQYQQQAAPAYAPQAQSYAPPAETVQQQIVITTVTRQQKAAQTYAAPPAAGYGYGSRALKAPACHSYGCR
jgi:nucleoside phosphorylase